MNVTPQEKKIADLARPVIEDLGFDLVCVKIIGENGSKSVQIMAEDPKTRRIGLDDCAKVSRAVAAMMDVEDPIEGAYRLENLKSLTWDGYFQSFVLKSSKALFRIPRP